jgi:predicted nucleic acid-binding Zn ribbon protein
MMIKELMEFLMKNRRQKSQFMLQVFGIFGGIPQNRSIIVLNQRTTGKPEEIYWAR